ncbi:MAG: ACP S-malonyltransferase [Chloroflexota bacterium]|nr:ACP S-malonyltransferase [Chloroflexota bacterium]
MSNSYTSDVTKPKIAYVFPGQGSQHVGMGKDLYENSSVARRIFDEADNALGRSLTGLMFEGPAEDLNLTINAQPAILTASLACLSTVQEFVSPDVIPEPNYAAGHSLGEYTALAATNVLSVPEAVRLVQERGRLMHETSQTQQGGMAAVVGLDELTLEEICRETGAYISNINAEDQIVIAGDKITLARAMDLASARGAKRLIMLQVSGAFHTDLMKPAVAGMTQAMSAVSFNSPSVPIIANCGANPLTDEDEIKEELIHQMCGCVQWKRSMSYLWEAGVTQFYEIGPGKVLSGLIRRICPDAQVSAVGDMKSLQSLVG